MKIALFIIVATSLTVLVSARALGTEVDSFTARTMHLSDSTDGATKIWVKALLECIKQANKHPGDVDYLYKACHARLGGFGWSKVENAMNTSKQMQSSYVPISRSIYKDIKIFQSPSFFATKLSHAFRFGDFIIGADKFGHMTEEGYQFYQKAFVNNEGIAAAMTWGEGTERTYYGYQTTGIYSFADLNADIIGMMFYKYLAPTAFNAHDDQDTYIIKDENGKWILNPQKPFTISNLLGPTLDESINCNLYKSKEFETAVTNAINELSKKNAGTPLHCPVTKQSCAALVSSLKFPEYKERLISPKCLTAAPKK